jgi:predicted metal-dependent TIM-barrel fold hydrolase
MPPFDPHIRMTSSTIDDDQAMAAAGVAAIVEPVVWPGRPRSHAGSFEDYFPSLFRTRKIGMSHYDLGAPLVDPCELFEGNSGLRGQAPRVDRA